MFRNLILLFTMIVIANTAFGAKIINTQLTVGSNVMPDLASALQVESTTGGFLAPRMTTVQRDLLNAPVPNGMMIYNSTLGQLEAYDTGVWSPLGGGSGRVPEWVTLTLYSIGSTVHYNNKFYKSLTIHTSGTFATDLANDEWVEMSMDYLAWETTYQYKVGNIVHESDHTYYCKTDHVSGTFATDLAANWTELSDSDDIKAIVASTDNALVRWDLATGAVVQDSTVLVGDTGAITGIESLAVGGALDASSILDTHSTTQGTRPCPSMTEAQRDLIAAPVNGLCIFNSDINKLNIYDGSTWVSAGGGLDAWVTSFAYKIGNVVHESNGIYLALTDHTSGTFATDLANLDWQELSTFREANFNISPPATTCSEGKLFWNDFDKTLNICTDQTGVSLQAGQEGHKRIYNTTGSTITDGQIVYINGFDGGSGLSTVALAQSDAAATSTVTLGVATHDIATGSPGIITTWGTVRDINTSTYSSGNVLYLSDTVAGAMTTTPPDSPHFVVRIGTVGEVHATTGSIDVALSIGNNKQDVVSVFNGAILEAHVVTVASDGATVTATLSNSLGGDLSLFLNTGFYVFTAPANVTLTAGSDTSPTLNYVYIPDSTKTLTASTAGWPAEQHVPVGTFFVQSAGSVQTDAPYKEHAWTDHMTGGDGQGHISHLNKWIRNQHATWLSGSAPTFAGSGTGSITFSATSGTVLQLHEHSVQAFGSPAEVRVINDSVTPYVSMTDLVNATLDSTGASLQGRTFALTIWGSVNETTGSSKLFMNLPSGSYSSSSPDLVRTDASKYTDYSIPDEFKGTGFLIHRLVIGINPPGTVWTIYAGDGDDIRGQFPNTVAGSSSTVATEFPDNAFAVFNVADNTKEVVLDVSGVTTGNTRTLTIPDASGTLALLDSGVDQVFTSDVRSTNKNGDTLAYADADNVLLTSWGDALTTSTFSEETVNQISGLVSYEIAVVTAEAGWVQSPSVVVEKRSQGNLIASKFKYTYDGDNGDMKAYLYDVTNSQTLGELYLDAASTVKGAVVYGNAADTTALIQLRIEAAVVNNGKLLVFDDVEFTDAALASANINGVSHTYIINQAGSALTNRAGEIEFNLATATIENTDTDLLSVVDDSSNTRTKFIATRSISVVASFSAVTGNITGYAQIYKNGVAFIDGNQAYAASRKVIISSPVHLNAGEYLTFGVIGDTENGAGNTLASVTATASNEHVLIGDERQQAHFVGKAQYVLSADYSTTSTSYVLPSLTLASSSVSGGVIQNTVNSPSITIPDAKVGTYKITVTGQIGNDVGNWGHTAIYDGTTYFSEQAERNAYVSTMTFSVDNITEGDLNLDLVLKTNGTIRIEHLATNPNLELSVTYLPPVEEASVITTVALPQSEKNSYAARIANNGTASITSVDADFIESVTRSADGVVDIVWKVGVFTVAPSVVATMDDTSIRSMAIEAVTALGVTIKAYIPNNLTLSDKNFSIKVTKQGADASSGQVYVGTVPRHQVMYVKDVKPSGTNGGNFASGAWKERDLTELSGDIFGSLSGGIVTVPAGTYEVEASAPASDVDSHKIKLYDLTAAADLIIGNNAQNPSGHSGQTHSSLFGTITLTVTTELRLRHRCTTTQLSNGFGIQTGYGVDEIYAQMKITKIR